MSDILIKGMEMPLHTERDGEKDTVFQCAIVVHQDNTAELVIRRDPANPFANCNEPHIDKCPLVEVPTPHGRLIDADKLLKEIEENSYRLRSVINSTENGMFLTGIRQAIDKSPTIIEAVVSEE